jgi:predicted small metal-binding protein
MAKPGKVLECGTIVPGCNFVAHADNEDELVIIAAAHARSVHGVDHLSEPLKAKIRSVIRDA